MTLFKNKYRVETARLREHDYASPGWYFVTICTKGRACFFGEVRGGVMGLSAAGCIAAQEWRRTPQVRPYVRLDVWVVMPNHVHGLIGIASETPAATIVETPRRDVSTAPEQRLKPHSLGAIVGRIKSVCTKRIRRTTHPDFGWQPRFHDHIVRDEQSLQRIRRYIQRNPAQWDRDRNHPGNQ